MAYRFSQSLIRNSQLKSCSTLMHEVISVAKTEFSLNTESKQYWMKRIFTYNNLKQKAALL